MEWIDANHIKGEMSDKDFIAKVNQEARTRDMKKYGRDGKLIVYEEKFVYKNIPYWIRVLRYYAIGEPDYKGINKIGKWAVLEYDNSMNAIAVYLNNVEQLTGVYGWLYKDTIHAGQENWTLNAMVEDLHIQAKSDIDELPEIKGKLTAKFNELLAEFDKLKIDA